jgi:hypothetical protein
MPPSFSCIIETKLPENKFNTISKIQKLLLTETSDLTEILDSLNHFEINFVLFSCKNEEEQRKGEIIYSIPDYSELPYAGFSCKCLILVSVIVF